MDILNAGVMVPSWVSWMAVDPDGHCFGYSGKPVQVIGNYWACGELGISVVKLYNGVKPKNWKDELYTWG